ncbi:phenylalanine--tRNA ligase beta subunit-related protein [Streptomyces sp. HK10]|uniref:phenylalanine--tRNA ligase beta subunit-related protein n=1 Tax=Streptomyces sp. HK10 TaxID=3373255 RepID=UPI003748B344
MKLTITGLRALLPGLTDDPAAFRNALDESGLEVKSIVAAGADTSVTLEFLANRGDHRCYAGVARELAARLGLPLAPLDVDPPEVGAGPPASVSSPLCLAYTLTPLEVFDATADLPPDTVGRLKTSAAHTGVAVLDAAEAANTELGQPVQVYDADRVVGAVEVRGSRPGESFRPVGAEEARELPEATLVVADEEKILSVAGVIGGEDSRVTAGTRRVLLESACYDPVSVRLAATGMGLSNAMSQRFERGADPTAVHAGAGRALALLDAVKAARRSGPTREARAWEGTLPTLPVDAARASAFLGTGLDAAEVAERLAAYGFREVARGEFEVPGTRVWDVRETEDLYEEIGRHIGFDELPAAPLPASTGAVLTPREALVAAVGGVLVGLGFQETFTDGFYGKDTLKLLGPPDGHPLAAHVGIANAEDRRYSMLKNNCLAQAVAAVGANLRFKQERIRLFEVTRVFEPAAGAENGLCRERPVLWAIASGALQDDLWSGKPAVADFFFLRGAAEECALRCGLELSVERLPERHPLADFLHPHRSALLLADGVPAGVCGEVHPDVRRRAALGGKRPVYLEFDLGAWSVRSDRGPRAPFREDPAVEKMLDFVLPRPVPSEAVLAVMREAAPDWLRSIEVTDVFLPDPADTTRRSVTYLLRFDSEPARPAEKFGDVLDLLVGAVTDRFGPDGVHLRT